MHMPLPTAYPQLLAGADVQPRRPRIALYSHDTMGLGHTRRNLLLAQSLAGSSLEPSILLLTGAWESRAFALPPRTDCLTLPSLLKSGTGSYDARRLDVPLGELTRLRSATLRAAVEAFAPDLLIVDNVARGANRELDATLDALRWNGRTRCVLGLRDVLDAPERVRREWARDDVPATIQQHYDEVWVYGDPAVYDLVREYGLPRSAAARVRYTGYLDQRERAVPPAEAAELLAELALGDTRLALCIVGGGQDGFELAGAFARAELPAGWTGVLVTGPFMPPPLRAELQAAAARRPELRVLELVREPAVLWQRADCVVTMGGYNAVCDALSWRTRTLVVPRVAPREEQLVRARRLEALGLLAMLHPDALAPAALARWIAAAPSAAPAGTRPAIDLAGHRRVREFAEELIATPRVGAGVDMEWEAGRVAVAS